MRKGTSNISDNNDLSRWPGSVFLSARSMHWNWIYSIRNSNSNLNLNPSRAPWGRLRLACCQMIIIIMLGDVWREARWRDLTGGNKILHFHSSNYWPTERWAFFHKQLSALHTSPLPTPHLLSWYVRTRTCTYRKKSILLVLLNM